MRQVTLMAMAGDEELAGNHPGALMDQLVKGMLAVGARLAPDDRA